MENNRIGDEIMDLDLNQEPLDLPAGPVVGFGTLLNDLETVHDRIEERIRHLQAVTARARQRRSWRPAPHNTETSSNLPSESAADGIRENGMHRQEVAHAAVTPGSVGVRGKRPRRDSYLVAEALGLDSGRVSKNGASFFDCNVCLSVAKDPVLTCCGHLFCWSCFYKLPYVDSATKECTNCLGEISEKSLTPIYGTRASNTESSSNVPPRPRAKRVESLRQQLQTNDGFSHVSVVEALRRIRASFGEMQHDELDIMAVNLGVISEALGNAEVISRNVRPRQLARVLSESAASLSSISSALNSAERLVGDLDTL